MALHVDDLRPRSSFSLFPGIRGQVDSHWRHTLHLGVGSQKPAFFNVYTIFNYLVLSAAVPGESRLVEPTSIISAAAK